MKHSLKTIGISAIIGTILFGYREYHRAWNNQPIKEPAYQIEVSTTGLPGFVEFTRYPDGSQDVKIYPRFPHRSFYSELYQDFNGDGAVDRIIRNAAVDRIRRNGAEFNNLSELLVRKQDYEAYKDRFDEADKQLQDLMARYQAKK